MSKFIQSYPARSRLFSRRSALLIVETIAVVAVCYLLAVNPAIGTTVGLALGYVALRRRR